MVVYTLVLGGLFGVVTTAVTVVYCACKAAKTPPSDRLNLEDDYEAACLASQMTGNVRHRSPSSTAGTLDLGLQRST